MIDLPIIGQEPEAPPSRPNPRHTRQVQWARFLHILGRVCGRWSEAHEHTPAQRLAFVAVLTLPHLRAHVLDVAARQGITDPEGQLYAVEAGAFILAESFAAWAAAADAHPDRPRDLPVNPADPTVCAVYSHRPGRDGQTTSLYVNTFSGCVAGYGWGRSRMGELVGFSPLPADLHVSFRQVGYENNSPNTRASRGFFARQRLRAILPADARKAVQRARKDERRPKARHLGGTPIRRERGRPTHYKTPEGDVFEIPAAYWEITKAETFLDDMDPLIRGIIAYYMAPEDFWKAATGQLYPDEVDAVLRVEPRTPAERKMHAKRARQTARAYVARHAAEEAGQASLF